MFLAPPDAPDYKNPVAVAMNGDDGIVAYGALVDAHARALAVLQGGHHHNGRRSGGGGATMGSTSRLPRQQVEVFVPPRSQFAFVGSSKRRQVNAKSGSDKLGSVVHSLKRKRGARS